MEGREEQSDKDTKMERGKKREEKGEVTEVRDKVTETKRQQAGGRGDGGTIKGEGEEKTERNRRMERESKKIKLRYRERERENSCYQNYQLKHILVSPGSQNFHLPTNLFLPVTFLIAFRVF